MKNQPTNQFQNSTSINHSQNNFDNTPLSHSPPSALFLLFCFSNRALTHEAPFFPKMVLKETFPQNNSNKTSTNLFRRKHLQNSLKKNLYQKKQKTSLLKNSLTSIYQKNFGKIQNNQKTVPTWIVEKMLNKQSLRNAQPKQLLNPKKSVVRLFFGRDSFSDLFW